MKVHFEELSVGQRAGGVEAATHELCQHLRACGIQVTRSGAAGSSADSPDCVHLHGVWSPWLVRQFYRWRRQGVPCMWTPHGMLEPWALAHKRTKKAVAWRLYQRRLLNSATAIHATSDGEARQFRALGLDRPIAVIPWGVALPSPGRAAEGERRTDDRSRTALFVGRIYPVKGLPMLVEAWARVRPPRWRMRIVGPDEAGHRAEVESLIRKSGCESAFEFCGELAGSAKDDAYKSADLFILPSHTENFGVAIGEAMAHGLPVVTTQGTPWKVLEEERCGWWCPVSVDGLRAALFDATRKSPEDLLAMGQRGRAVVAERFEWGHLAEQFSELYRWSIGEGRPPNCFR